MHMAAVSLFESFNPSTAEPMTIQVPAHIEKLIFLHDSVALPSFGVFVATRSAARVDQESGMLLPPLRSLHFEESSTADDGLLLADLANTHQLSPSDARQVLQRWVEGLRERLESREIVSIPGIGRLYKNYTRRVQFLPDVSHFSAEHFVKPTLQFSPLGEVRQVLDLPQEAQAEHPSGPKTPVRSSRRLLWLSVTLLLVALGAGAYWLWSERQPGNANAADSTATPEVVQRESPSAVPEVQAPEVVETPKVNTPPTQTAPVVKPAPRPAKIAPPAPDPKVRAAESEKTCVLVVATKQDKREAEVLRNSLKNSAYNAYLISKNGHQVHVRFPYDQLGDIQQAIFDIQLLTGERDIWIKQK
jgi:nucleoid DNA-binding protein